MARISRAQLRAFDPKRVQGEENYRRFDYWVPDREPHVEKADRAVHGFAKGKGASGDKAGEIPRWKRVLDLTLILLSSPLWWPLMVLLALWVKTVSPGPVFFLQKRVGHRGKQFMIYKFRSMKVNAETGAHENHFENLVKSDCPMTKLDSAGDSRIIRGGRIMRASGLDELPQIFNVIRGEMSLVGPRPCTLSEYSRYEGYQRERFNVLPGLTGYWQVNGKNKTTFTEMIDLDIHYARHTSPRLDLEIIARTIPALHEQVMESRRRVVGGVNMDRAETNERSGTGSEPEKA